ncbi:MAG: hypothetical protein R2838_21570 [Caldilineaceae bacterium]
MGWPTVTLSPLATNSVVQRNDVADRRQLLSFNGITRGHTVLLAAGSDYCIATPFSAAFGNPKTLMKRPCAPKGGNTGAEHKDRRGQLQASVGRIAHKREL